jgi:hypothetical protein
VPVFARIAFRVIHSLTDDTSVGIINLVVRRQRRLLEIGR